MNARTLIEAETAPALSPMMQQYYELKKRLGPDTLLMLRLGDFYEFFGDDAKEAAKLLNLTLTKRREMPMCGVPYHAVDTYARKLVAAGKKVAIANEDRQGSLRTLNGPTDLE